jgi:hypothetical protein
MGVAIAFAVSWKPFVKSKKSGFYFRLPAPENPPTLLDAGQLGLD